MQISFLHLLRNIFIKNLHSAKIYTGHSTMNYLPSANKTKYIKLILWVSTPENQENKNFLKYIPCHLNLVADERKTDTFDYLLCSKHFTCFNLIYLFLEPYKISTISPHISKSEYQRNFLTCPQLITELMFESRAGWIPINFCCIILIIFNVLYILNWYNI